MTGRNSPRSAYHYQNQFDAAPGHYKMTVVLSAGSDTYGKSSWPLDIDTYDGKQFALGGVVMSNSAQRVDELSNSADFDSVLLEDRTPLVVKGLQVVANSGQSLQADRQGTAVLGGLRFVAGGTKSHRAS